MNQIKDRIPLQIVKGSLVLNTLLECSSLRVRRQLIRFVVDTGSSDSYLSYKEVKKLQIPIKERPFRGEVDVGGSRFKVVKLPKFTMYLLKDGSNNYITLKVSLSALKTTKVSEKKVEIAETLPCILGLDFLKEQKLSLHVVLTEDLAYLQCEK